MHAISSYCGNRPTNMHTNPHTHTHTHTQIHTHTNPQTGPITIHCAAASAQCKHCCLLTQWTRNRKTGERNWK